MNKQFYNMKELGEILPIGTTNLYNLVHSTGFPSIKINRKIVVPVDGFNNQILNFTPCSNSASGRFLFTRRNEI